MTTYAWTDLRSHAVERFSGQTPGAELEQRIIDVFQHHPQIVAAAIDRIAEKFHAGTIRSPWPVLALDIEQATANNQLTATDTTDREKAIRSAEQWLRSAGAHYDRAAEILDALFDPVGYGDKGASLAAWDSGELRERMLTLWREVQPIGQRLEAEHVDRLERWQEQHR